MRIGSSARLNGMSAADAVLISFQKENSHALITSFWFRCCCRVMVAGLAACAAPSGPSYPAGTAYPSGNVYPAGTAYPTSSAPAAAVEYGRITNVEVVRTQAPAGSNAAGTIIGGIAGAVIGHQIGRYRQGSCHYRWWRRRCGGGQCHSAQCQWRRCG